MRWLAVIFGVAVLVTACGVVWVNEADMKPKLWHIDPTTAERTGRPNDYLVAPEGATNVSPDRVSDRFEESPDSLLDRFAAIALAEPRVVEIGTPGAFRTFVQRSQLIGFPDYISVKAVPVEGGASLIVYSRAQYGYSDWGVNKARVEDWLSKL
ncbi:MAG: DUF1499 domain-containing protein [Pseudomonadota bacterium]